jgi:hypothetical protein
MGSRRKIDMKTLACILAALLVCMAVASATPVVAAPPPSPYQQRPDIFPCDGCRIADMDGNGVGDMQDLNPTTLKAKATRAIAYRVVLRPGCSAGSIPTDLAAMNAHVQDVGLGLTLTRTDAAPDFNVYISCGLEQISKCGGVNVFCLPDGFPYDTDVYLSDVLSGWEAGSRLGIPLHEIVGHAIGTWNEQYAICGASCGFASTPNQRDIMNTGPLSRHGIEQVELDRWERTMWSLAPSCIGDPCWDGASWQFSAAACPITDGVACSWSPSPAPYGTWYGPDGVALWDGCDPRWNGRHTTLAEPGWFHVGQGLYVDRLGYWTYAPAC